MADIIVLTLDDPVDASLSSINSNFSALNTELGDHEHSASAITSGVLAPARLGSGTASASTFLRGDQQWASVAPSDLASGGASSGNLMRWSGSAWGPSAGLTVDASGKIGIGTTPNYHLHVLEQASAGTSAYIENNYGAAGALAQVRCLSWAGAGAPSGGFFVGLGSRGTKASPSPTQSGDRLLALIGAGQQDTTPGTGGTGAMVSIEAAGNWSTTDRHSVVRFHVNGPGQALFPPPERMRIEGEGAMVLQPAMQTPSSPAVSSEAKIYIRNNKLVIQYNDAGTVRYKYLDLTGTGVTWQHSTTAP